MIKLFLIRHGEAEAGWAQALDPGLSAAGHAQARAIADLFAACDAMRVVASPLLRAQQSAAPLAQSWGVDVTVDKRFREMPSPVPANRRADWLRGIMRANFEQLDDTLQAWRNEAWRALLDFDGDTLVFTHFMLVNALVARASNDPRVVVFEPDNGSITQLSRDNTGEIAVIELGVHAPKNGDILI